MANTLNGINLTVIAQEALPVLQKRLAPISLFTTDFSAEVATKGSAISTRYVTPVTAADFNRDVGYTGSAVTSTAVTVTLNKHKFFVASFDDSEIGNASLPVLQRTFIQPAVNAIGNAVQADLFALMTTAFPGAYSSSYANFGFAGITTCAKVLDNSGSTAPRAALLGTNLFYDVLDDIKGIYSVGSDALRNGEVGMLGNVATALVPCTEFAGSGLAGFVGGQDALCIASRQPGIPNEGNPGVQVVPVTLPNGFTVQLRQWYDPTRGLWNIGAMALYGVIRGNPSSGVRIITTD